MVDDWDEADDENPFVMKIRDPLQPADREELTTKELHTLIHDGQIDLNPPYQRDVVWPEHKQIRLIDSIFRNFYVPPIVFTVSKDDDGEVIRICVDGKQRLTSIQKFIDGQIPYRDSVTGKSFWYTIPESLRASRLEVPIHYKRLFEAKRIICAEYHNLAPTTEREIFQRVQLGMALTVAEKMQAISSPRATWISGLQEKWVLSDSHGLANIMDWDTKRGRDYQNLAQFVYLCGTWPNQTVPTAQKTGIWLDDRAPLREQFKQKVEQVLANMSYIARHPLLNKGFKKPHPRVAPVEFVFIGVMLFLMPNISHDQRSQNIYNLRKNLRSKFTDVRNNTQVVKASWQFIDKLMDEADDEVHIIESPSVVGSRPRRSLTRKKRRYYADNDDDEDYDDSGDYNAKYAQGSTRGHDGQNGHRRRK
ncbi:hypothetical protein NEOLEDRAFT_1074056 [Neolentinus lepideus HHB14362 ss-1]|uniref:GmrSD restriction endonucleases N-terminal domain-containing protein n=1 Tax=Neolentinus lepideus HHB14362 ss-1 TaxID=1314782 RepID=A0A165PKT0_9AGAM|nr:hypothetical protein NEOLEDRAFT_1074056 [Neolentinus lepideus HHB14362 ss-1]